MTSYRLFVIIRLMKTNQHNINSCIPCFGTVNSMVYVRPEDSLTSEWVLGEEWKANTSMKLFGEFFQPITKNNILDNIDTVIFSLKETEEKSGRFTLNTIVRFKDGSKSIVRNSELDPITDVKYTKHGFPYATDETKELGLIYAIIKYIISDKRKEDGTVEGDGYVRKLNTVIKNARDDSFIAEEKVNGKEERAKKHQERIEHDKEVAEKRKKRISQDLIETTINLLKQHITNSMK